MATGVMYEEGTITFNDLKDLTLRMKKKLEKHKSVTFLTLTGLPRYIADENVRERERAKEDKGK